MGRFHARVTPTEFRRVLGVSADHQSPTGRNRGKAQSGITTRVGQLDQRLFPRGFFVGAGVGLGVGDGVTVGTGVGETVGEGLGDTVSVSPE